MESFSTDRLSVRSWAPDLTDPQARSELEAALKEVLTSDVLRHLPEPIQLSQTPSAVSDWVSARAAESDVFLVSDAETEVLVGLLILAFDAGDPDQSICHVGYLLAESAWGRGYATELVTGLIEVLQRNGPMTIIGGVGKENVGSARVLEKAGFRMSAELSDDETSMFLFAIE